MIGMSGGGEVWGADVAGAGRHHVSNQLGKGGQAVGVGSLGLYSFLSGLRVVVMSSGSSTNSTGDGTRLSTFFLYSAHLRKARERFQDIYSILLVNSLDPARGPASQWAF
ncbi:hypothetical protein E2C01_101971 [Portunus trituberculatus]|uniref:Uncharacterized protein n=1 Tax=Portunus trituberculatus TaxID=210409 RepID=A0A5B7KLH1_PORTR|nr:hypothetical protein [Portunus trituberculatus]